MSDEVAILTGCQDRSYAVGLALALAASKVRVEFVAGDSLDGPDLRSCHLVRFLNLRGKQNEDASGFTKLIRVLRYYARLIRYSVSAQPRVFHILWNNKFETFDRTLLMLWYKLTRRKIVVTAHNINAAARDGRDSWMNRLTLRCQYRLADHIFVHSERLRKELEVDFGIAAAHTSVVPFGINNTVPSTNMTRLDARQRLGLDGSSHVALFFGQIAPYKGLHWLLRAMPAIVAADPEFQLLVAGKVKKGSEQYFDEVRRALDELDCKAHVRIYAAHVPDDDIEIFFKAADVVVLPYETIFQSGVPFVAFWFGKAVVATAVGSLPDDIVSGRNGLLCEPRSSAALATAVSMFFDSALYREASDLEQDIRACAEARHSWDEVAARTSRVYAALGQAR